MDRLKRDLYELLLGLGVLALGIGILLFTFTQAFALAMNPGPWFEGQLPQAGQEQGPASSFTWSLSGFNLTVTDRSTEGSAPITSWDWEWGDGNRFNGPNPPTYQYGSEGQRIVLLTVRDVNGRESWSGTSFYVSASASDGGLSQVDPGGLEVNLDFSNMVLPVAIALLTFGLYVVMAIAGGMITKAGWNLVKPRPETIRVRLKPKHLTQAIEEDAGTASAAASANPELPPPPPPPS